MSGWSAPPPKKTVVDNRWLSWLSVGLIFLAGLGLITFLWFKMATATSNQIKPTHSLEQVGTIISSTVLTTSVPVTPTLVTITPTRSTYVAPDYSALIRFCQRVPYQQWEFDADRLDLPAEPGQAALTSFTGGRVTFRPSCTFETGNQPEYVILHSTGGNTLEGAVATLRKEGGASIHYVIDRNGTVVQMLPESLMAHHVTCQSDTCLTAKSIGIELVNLGHVNPEAFKGLIYEDPLRAFNYPYWEDYPPEQRQALNNLVQEITARWGIPLDQEHVMGHFQLNHKTDPGPALNLWWDRPGDLLSPIFSKSE